MVTTERSTKSKKTEST